MKIVFATNNKIGSLFIRWFTWSRYSHVALVWGSNVIEATLAHGVRVFPFRSFVKKYKSVLLCNVKGVDEKKAVAFTLNQLNKPYDIKAIFGFVLRRKWTDAERWFCSELVAVALHEGGVTLIKKEAHRVTPEDLLCSPLVEEEKEIKNEGIL